MKHFIQAFIIGAALAISGCATARHDLSAIATRADVRVDDGRTYAIETYYAAVDNTAVRQTRPNGEVNISVIAGDRAWTTDSHEDGGDMLRTVVLGHQFHALLVHFDSILSNIRAQNVVQDGETYRARDGDWPFGEGGVRLLTLDERPLGLILNFAGVPEISVSFDDWRDTAGTSLPYHLNIDDGTHTFDYTFTTVAPAVDRPGWAHHD